MKLKWKRGYDWSSVAVVMLPTDNVVSVEYGCTRERTEERGRERDCLDGLFCSPVHIVKWCSIYSVLSIWNRIGVECKEGGSKRRRTRKKTPNCIFVHLRDSRRVLSIQSKFRFILKSLEKHPIRSGPYYCIPIYPSANIKLWNWVLCMCHIYCNFVAFASNGGAYQHLNAALMMPLKTAFLLWLLRISCLVVSTERVWKKMKLTCGISITNSVVI